MLHTQAKIKKKKKLGSIKIDETGAPVGDRLQTFCVTRLSML